MLTLAELLHFFVFSRLIDSVAAILNISLQKPISCTSIDYFYESLIKTRPVLHEIFDQTNEKKLIHLSARI